MSSAKPRFIEVFDTTLRDGGQTEGISYSVDDKLRIARKLDELGVAFIEGGWPGSNPKHALSFEQARKETWTTAKLVALAVTAVGIVLITWRITTAPTFATAP